MLYRDNGKEQGNYYLGFRVSTIPCTVSLTFLCKLMRIVVANFYVGAAKASKKLDHIIQSDISHDNGNSNGLQILGCC